MHTPSSTCKSFGDWKHTISISEYIFIEQAKSYTILNNQTHEFKSISLTPL